MKTINGYAGFEYVDVVLESGKISIKDALEIDFKIACEIVKVPKRSFNVSYFCISSCLRVIKLILSLCYDI